VSSSAGPNRHLTDLSKRLRLPRRRLQRKAARERHQNLLSVAWLAVPVDRLHQFDEVSDENEEEEEEEIVPAKKSRAPAAKATAKKPPGKTTARTPAKKPAARGKAASSGTQSQLK